MYEWDDLFGKIHNRVSTLTFVSKVRTIIAILYYMTDRYQNKYRIPSTCLPDWDYGANGVYETFGRTPLCFSKGIRSESKRLDIG